jgi:hypothetical protein
MPLLRPERKEKAEIGLDSYSRVLSSAMFFEKLSQGALPEERPLALLGAKIK